MRTSALTCIRSKATPPYHNCYSRKLERERHGRRPNYYWAQENHQSCRSPVRLTADAASSEIEFSLLDLQGSAFWYHPLLDKAPQGDRQFASERNDTNLAFAHPHPTKPLLPPQRELAVGLIAEPGPSQLDQSMPSKLFARLVDSAITVGIAAVVGAGCDLRTKQRVVAFRMSHMEELNVRRLPVINKNKRMIGILSLGDVSHSAPAELLLECIKSVSAHH
jgi:hypothetical protein